MDLVSIAIGFVIGVAVSVFAPAVWAKIQSWFVSEESKLK
jgi:hypothetical protein